jgi:cation-transporting P-type ATPase E
MPQLASEITGLSTENATMLAAQADKVLLPLRSNRSYWQILRANILNTYNVILIVSAFLVLLFEGSKDVLVSVGLVIINMSVGIFQEIRAKKMLDRLATLNTHIIRVRRDGQSKDISINDVVEGDVIELYPGVPVIADGPVLFSDSLEMDESSLSGESESIPKTEGSQLTSGSYCLTGFGLMRAEKVGKKSSLYALTEKAKHFRASETILEKWLKRLFRILLFTIFLLAPLTLISGINQGFTFSQSLTNVVNLISSLIPQGMIMSMTVLFAYGVLNMSKYKTLVQRLNAIASFGAITVLCTDKTGTLTTNQLSLDKIVPLQKNSKTEVNEKLTLFATNISWANKTIQAILTFFTGNFAATKEKLLEVPFTSDRKWSGITFDHTTLILGAPEMLTNDEEILARVQELAKDGSRVLAFAESKTPLLKGTKQKLPATLTFLALVTFCDHLRPDVHKTIEALEKNNIRLKVISGDSAATLRGIALQVHLPTSKVYEQKELEDADAETFSVLVRTGHFFARITPEMKERIVAELIRQGEYVGMIGDGVNDVRALKRSQVAIVVNEGAQVAKDIADIILLDNAFTALPRAIEEGKDITQRVYAVAKIFFVKVIYLITLFLLAGFASFAFPISLRQTTWLGFIVVGIPTTLIAFKILQPSPTKNIQKGLIQYTLTAGVMGGVFMAVLMIVIQLVFQEDMESSRTQVSLFASLYSTFILFQVHGINLFSWQSIRKNLVSFLIILTIGFLAVLFPGRLAPGAFKSAHLDYADWLLLTFGIAGSVVLLRVILKKIHPFQIIQSLVE